MSLGPKQPKQPRPWAGQIARQPACVTGPRQGTPRATATHTTPSALHSAQTLVDGTRGFRPTIRAVRISTSWPVSIGQPRSSKSTGTCSAIAVLVASVLMKAGEA